jgi:hypothetical protein
MQEFWQQTFAVYAAQGKDGVDLYFMLPGASRYNQLSGFNWPLIQGDIDDYPQPPPQGVGKPPLPDPPNTITIPRQLLPTLPWNGKLGGTAPKKHGAKQ